MRAAFNLFGVAAASSCMYCQYWRDVFLCCPCMFSMILVTLEPCCRALALVCRAQALHAHKRLSLTPARNVFCSRLASRRVHVWLLSCIALRHTLCELAPCVSVPRPVSTRTRRAASVSFCLARPRLIIDPFGGHVEREDGQRVRVCKVFAFCRFEVSRIHECTRTFRRL